LLLGCQKDDIRPLNFFLRGDFDGTFIAKEMSTSFSGIRSAADFENKVVETIPVLNNCSPNSSFIEASSRWENLAGVTPINQEESYRINFRKCLADGVEGARDTFVVEGVQQFQSSVADEGVEIVWWKDGDNTVIYSSRNGGQSGSEFVITSHEPVDGQEFLFVTEGYFSCNIYDPTVIGDTLRLRDFTFKIKTIPSGL